MSVFETNIRFVGGLLTLYSFTGDPMFKDKAQYVADKLLPAFQTPTGVPNALVNTKTGVWFILLYYYICIAFRQFIFFI